MPQNPLSSSRGGLLFGGALMLLAGGQWLATTQFYALKSVPALVDAVLQWLLLGLLVYGLVNGLSTLRLNFQRWIGLVLVLPLLVWGSLHLAPWAGLNILQSLGRESAPFQQWLWDTRLFRGLVMLILLYSISAITTLWQRLQEKLEKDRHRSEVEQLSREAELYKLRQQLQPHFLFNSLNSVNALIGSDPRRARQMMQQLSDFFRYTVRQGDDKLISLDMEWEHLQLYLAIEQVRFGHRLRVEQDLSEAARQRLMPPLLLQPLVENAVKHGLYGTTGETHITVAAWSEARKLHIAISNPYDPEEPTRPGGTGFGLRSVNRRLYLQYGRTDLLRVSREAAIFKVQISLPQNEM
ncbi:MAG: histidine kinase [Schleiferiaceae bacterium]|nr:histidine kinase [Schleiferiaceae bacterium]